MKMAGWPPRVEKPHRPDFVLFDLDPPDDGFREGVRAARLVGDALTEIGLEGYPKTSGAGGMHVLVRIVRRATFERAHELARLVAERLEERHPGVVTTEWRKEKRRGVFIDHNQ